MDAQAGNPSARDDPGRPLVLVVDDQSEARRFACLCLEFEPCQVMEASHGEQALELTQRLKPDLVIVDILMPGLIDGLEVCRRIKDTPDLAHARVLMVSGQACSETRELVRNAGADAFLAKPFGFVQLVETVERLLKSVPAPTP